MQYFSSSLLFNRVAFFKHLPTWQASSQELEGEVTMTVMTPKPCTSPFVHVIVFFRRCFSPCLESPQAEEAD